MKYLINILMSVFARAANFFLNIVIVRFYGGDVLGGYVTVQNLVLSFYVLINAGQSYNLLYFKQKRIRGVLVLLNFLFPILSAPLVFLVLEVIYDMSVFDVLVIILAIFLNSITGIYISSLYYKQKAKKAIVISSMSSVVMFPFVLFLGVSGFNLSHSVMIVIFYSIPVMLCMLTCEGRQLWLSIGLNRVKLKTITALLKRGASMVLGVFILGFVNTLFLLNTYSNQPDINTILALVFPVIGVIVLIPTSLNNLILSDKDKLKNVLVLKLVLLLLFVGFLIYLIGWDLYMLAIGNIIELGRVELLMFIMGGIFLATAKLYLSLLLKKKLYRSINRVMLSVLVLSIVSLELFTGTGILNWSLLYLLINLLMMGGLYSIHHVNKPKKIRDVLV